MSAGAHRFPHSDTLAETPALGGRFIQPGFKKHQKKKKPDHKNVALSFRRDTDGFTVPSSLPASHSSPSSSSLPSPSFSSSPDSSPRPLCRPSGRGPGAPTDKSGRQTDVWVCGGVGAARLAASGEKLSLAYKTISLRVRLALACLARQSFYRLYHLRTIPLPFLVCPFPFCRQTRTHTQKKKITPPLFVSANLRSYLFTYFCAAQSPISFSRISPSDLPSPPSSSARPPDYKRRVALSVRSYPQNFHTRSDEKKC